MPEYMDYGVIGDGEAPQVPVSTTRHSQVYLATHDGVGNSLPLMDRSFISFSYGGKSIEDFGLIATISGDRLQKSLYASFKDNITTSEIWDGQFYWSTHYQTNSLTFTLSTDGITERELNEFLMWFKPGINRELVLSEHPNRGIFARVSNPPEMSMLPFEKKVSVKIAGQEQKVSTTLYKGDITLNFIMDNPFWHSKVNLFKLQDGSTDIWQDAFYKDPITFGTNDVIKIYQEDDVPQYDIVEKQGEGKPIILFGTESSVGNTRIDISRVNVDYNINIDKESVISIDPLEEDEVAEPTIDPETGEATDTPIAYFYYAGTAPCVPTLKFGIVPKIDNSSQPYLVIPKNSFSDTEGQPYNIIAFQGHERQYFAFSTPSVFTGYNQAIKIFLTYEGSSWEDIRVALRDGVKHWAPRAYAIKAIDDNKGDTNFAQHDSLVKCITTMKQFLKDEDNEMLPAYFIINGETGEATGIFIFRLTDDSLKISVENVGDMIKTKYFKIEAKNYPTDEGYIDKWSEEHPEYSYRIYADCKLNEFNILYKYLYL